LYLIAADLLRRYAEFRLLPPADIIDDILLPMPYACFFLCFFSADMRHLLPYLLPLRLFIDYATIFISDADFIDVFFLLMLLFRDACHAAAWRHIFAAVFHAAYDVLVCLPYFDYAPLLPPCALLLSMPLAFMRYSFRFRFAGFARHRCIAIRDDRLHDMPRLRHDAAIRCAADEIRRCLITPLRQS